MLIGAIWKHKRAKFIQTHPFSMCVCVGGISHDTYSSSRQQSQMLRRWKRENSYCQNVQGNLQILQLTLFLSAAISCAPLFYCSPGRLFPLLPPSLSLPVSPSVPWLRLRHSHSPELCAFCPFFCRSYQAAVVLVRFPFLTHFSFWFVFPPRMLRCFSQPMISPTVPGWIIKFPWCCLVSWLVWLPLCAFAMLKMKGKNI